MSQPDMIGALMSEMLESGWAGLEGAEERAAKFNQRAQRLDDEERRRQSGIVHAALDNEAGRAFLVLLMRKTLARPPTQGELNAPDIKAYAIAAAERRGQNAVMFMILEMLEWGRRDGKPAEVEP